ncbi:MAG: ABC transporter ATP-binding protein, partial [Proteobacteria bacterium]|nr:ABC transporter ATP-binding protein [Pseudomonadota bacterium]
SHDVHFIRALASTVIHISAGTLTRYAGDYQYYLDKSGSSSERDALIAPGDYRPEEQVAEAAPREKMGLKEIKELRRAEAEARKAANKAARDAKSRLTAVETEVHTLEERQKALVTELEDPATFSNGKAFSLNRELADLQERLGNLLQEWDRLSESIPNDTPES